MSNTDIQVRREQFRQARQIHGGTFNMFAAALGVRLSRVPIPFRGLRERVYRTLYGKKYHALNEDELERPLADFRSLNELFTRGVKPGCRQIAAAENQFVCPCDSTVQEVGRLQENKLLTVKGIEYTLSSLLPEIDTTPYENGSFAIFFLSPADCHRIFAPQSGRLHGIVHVPGRRLLVHPPYQQNEFPVFTLNERVILRLSTPLGSCLLVMVAGWGVGHITHPFAVHLKPDRLRVTSERFEAPRVVNRGDWIATFELGSTVILITEPRNNVVAEIEHDQQVHYGQPALSF